MKLERSSPSALPFIPITSGISGMKITFAFKFFHCFGIFIPAFTYRTFIIRTGRQMITEAFPFAALPGRSAANLLFSHAFVQVVPPHALRVSAERRRSAFMPAA